MRRLSLASAGLLALLTVVGCSSGGSGNDVDGVAASKTTADAAAPPSTASGSPFTGSTGVNGSTVIIRGKEYTCGEVVIGPGEKCSESYQGAFDEYRNNIDAYVTSGRLGPLGTPDVMRYEDAAAFGLAACIVAARGDDETVFVDFMRKYYPKEDGVALLPFWFGAERFLCPDVKFPHAPSSGDFVLP